MQPFSQKIVAVANVLVLTCLFFFVCIGTTQKKTEEKSNLLQFHKIIGTLNLIFGSTPFGKNN